MSRLFIRLGAPAVQNAADEWVLERLSWVLLEDEGELVSQGQGDGAALARLLEHRGVDDATGVVLLLPTEHAMLLELNVPGRSGSQIRRALPYVLEEYLATEIDDMHLVHGPVQRGEPIRCASVERRLIAQWLAALNEIHLRPVAMLPEAALLPTHEAGVSALFDEHDVLITSGAQSAVVDAEFAVMALAGVVAEMDSEQDCTVTTINGVIAPLDRTQVEENFDGTIHWVEDDTEVPALVYLARRWIESPGDLNLLHGEFAPPREVDPDWQKLRPAAVLIGVWVALASTLQAGSAFWADYRADALTDEVEAVYRDYFPDERRVVDPYRQMAQHIGQREGEGVTFTQLLGHLSAEVANAGAVSMRSVAFNANKDELSAELTIGAFEGLDALKEALADRGLEVEIASAEQQDDGIHARMRVRGGA